MVRNSILALVFSLLALPVGAAQIAQFSPQGQVAVVKSVKVVFDTAVIAFGNDQADAPMDLTCSDPSIKGHGRWTDAKRWTYVFTSDLGPGVQCQAKVASSFRTLTGDTLRGKTSFVFSTGGPRVVGSRPYGSTIDEDQVFVLRFNGQVQPESVLARTVCLVEGLGEAVPVRLIDGAQRTAILKANYIPDGQDTAAIQLVQCKRLLPASAKVQLNVGAATDTPLGLIAGTAQALNYTVREPFKATFSCQRENANAPCTPILPIRLSFSAPIFGSDAQQIRLKTSSRELKPSLQQGSAPEESVTSVRFDGPFPENTEFTITIPAGLTDDAGRALSNADQFPLTTRTAAFPPLVKFAAAPFGVIERFANVPEGETEADFPPSVPLTVRNVEAALRATDLPISMGTVRDYAPQDDVDVLQWYSRVRRLNDGGHWTVQQLKSIMGDSVPASAGADEKIIDVREFSALSKQANTVELALPAPSKNDPRPFEVIGVPISKPGFHVLEVQSARLGASLIESKAPMYVRTAALITNLGVHVKRGRDDVLAWVTTLDEGKVVPNAMINVLSCSGKVLASGKTDAQGLWHYSGVLDSPNYCEDTELSGLYVSARIASNHPLARNKADFSFVFSSWNEGIEPWRFNVPTDRSPKPTIVTHTVFDRSLFRAGETVSMKHFIRAQTRDGLALPPDASSLPKKLRIAHQGSGQRYEQALVWSKTPSGGLNAQSQFVIPKTAALGVYGIVLTSGDDYAQTEGEFRVEEFKLPVLTGSLKISSTDGDAPLIAPSLLDADVQISYVSGGPAGALPVSVSGVVRNKWLSFTDYDDYSFAPPRASDDDEGDQREGGGGSDAQSLFLNKKAIVLDAQGGARLPIDSLPKIRQPKDLLFEASFADPNGEIQTLSQSVAVWPSGVVAGVRTSGWVKQRQETAISSVALSPSGQPQANVDITVSAVSHVMYSVRKRMVGGFYSYDHHTERHELGTLCRGKTDNQGLLLCTVKLDKPGSIELIATAKDQQGRQSQAASDLWVAGARDLWFGGENDDRIDIVPEKKTYAPGETAQLQVRMPFREATALVSVEREGVLQTQVVELSGTDPRVSVPIQPQWGPNVYVSVLVLRGRIREVPWYSFLTWGWRQPKAWYGAYTTARKAYAAPTALVDLSKPAFRFGLTEIRVSDQQDQLTVKVSADKPSYQVRGKANVVIQVSLPDGKPAANGQVAFAAVDQALLELSPNPSWDLLEAMRQRRSYGVETATAQMQVVGRRHYGRKALPAGGGGGKSPTRELLDTLLLWKPMVQLDDQGKANLTVPLNDSISRFKLVAIADYGAGRFGTGSASIATTQDLQAISGLPAVVREGDRYQAMVTVRNTTQRAMQIQVEASYAGDGVPDEKLPSQKVQVAAGSAQLVMWPLQVPEGNALQPESTLTWQIQAREIVTKEGSEKTSAAADHLVITQRLIPSVPVNAKQSTLMALDADTPIKLAVAVPQGALLNASGNARGGLEIVMQSSLGGGLPGVKQWFAAYPYTCIEQLSSKAIGMRDAKQWDAVMHQLPNFLDDDGLASYFPGARQGNEVLTAYLLAASNEARALGLPFAIPDASKELMQRGLVAFLEGKIVRKRWAPVNDLDVRKLLVMEALSREGLVNSRMLGSIAIRPNDWPTSAVIDWLAVLQRVPNIPNKAAQLEQARQVIQARLLSRGTELVFANDVQNDWWWLMLSPQVNAAKLMLTVIGQPGWDDDMPRLAQGLMASQRNGAWKTTTANLMASLALEKFSQRYESSPITGKTRIRFSSTDTVKTIDWNSLAAQARSKPRVGNQGLPRQGVAVKAPSDVAIQRAFAPWTRASSDTLMVDHHGQGHGWVTVRSLAAVPTTKPIMAGYALTREVTPVTQAQQGVWSRGDVYRVKISVTSKTPTTWAVVSDPIPSGATILGSGLGRDSAIASKPQANIYRLTPSFIERSFDSFRAYYEYLPQGTTHIEYTVRLNAVGSFQLPPTRAEALYQPDVYGLLPNLDGLTVQALATEPEQK